MLVYPGYRSRIGRQQHRQVQLALAQHLAEVYAVGNGVYVHIAAVHTAEALQNLIVQPEIQTVFKTLAQGHAAVDLAA